MYRKLDNFKADVQFLLSAVWHVSHNTLCVKEITERKVQFTKWTPSFEFNSHTKIFCSLNRDVLQARNHDSIGLYQEQK